MQHEDINELKLSGVIETIPGHRDNNSTAVLRVNAGGRPFLIGVVLHGLASEVRADLKVGDRVEIQGRLKYYQKKRGVGLFNVEARWLYALSEPCAAA